MQERPGLHSGQEIPAPEAGLAKAERALLLLLVTLAWSQANRPPGLRTGSPDSAGLEGLCREDCVCLCRDKAHASGPQTLPPREKPLGFEPGGSPVFPPLPGVHRSPGTPPGEMESAHTGCFLLLSLSCSLAPVGAAGGGAAPHCCWEQEVGMMAGCMKECVTLSWSLRHCPAPSHRCREAFRIGRVQMPRHLPLMVSQEDRIQWLVWGTT